MATSGYISLEDGTYTMPESHKEVLVGTGSELACGPFFNVIPSMANVIGDLKHAYKHGGGVEYSRYTEDFMHMISEVNRYFFENELLQQWLYKIPDLKVGRFIA